MLDNAVKIIKQRQQTVNEQLKRLQAEAGKLEKALRVLETLSDVATGKARPPTHQHKISAAGRCAITAAAQTRWAKVRTQKEAEAKAHLLPGRDHHRVNFRVEQAEQDEKALLTTSERSPCTCGGINPNCMYCAGTGMR